jgi:hypothetical protein
MANQNGQVRPVTPERQQPGQVQPLPSLQPQIYRTESGAAVIPRPYNEKVVDRAQGGPLLSHPPETVVNEIPRGGKRKQKSKSKKSKRKKSSRKRQNCYTRNRYTRNRSKKWH